MTRKIFLSLGSNIGPEKHIPACLEALKKNFRVLRVSNVYETDPVGPAGGGKFWNGVVEIESDMNPAELGHKLREIEASLGRRRDPSDKFAPRTIDIDVLPQPGYQKMGFIMVPLAEIAPKTLDEESGKPFEQLAESFGEEKKSYRKVRL